MSELIPPGSTLRAGKEAINGKIAALEEVDALRQTQITEEQQARIAADGAHAAAPVAHTAEQIQFVEGQSVKQKVEAQQAQINNIIGGPTSSAAEVIDGRMGADGTARATLGTMIRELHSKQLAQADQTATIKRGLNLLNTSQASGAEVKVQGRTLVNLLGIDGNFENDSNGDGVADRWQTAGPGTRNTDYASAKYGRSAQRISSLSGDSHTGRNVRYPTPNLKAGKYLYLVDAITDGVSIARVTVAKLDGNPISNGTVTTMQTTSNKTLYSKVDATSELADASVWIQNTSAVGTVGWVSFDGARLYEISAAEYAKIDLDPEYTGEKLAEKFPYVDSVQHLQGGAVRKVGKNVLPPFSEWKLHANATISSPYEMTLNATNVAQDNWLSVPVVVGATYTIKLNNGGNANAVSRIYKTQLNTHDVSKMLTGTLDTPITFTVDSSYNGYVSLRLTSGAAGICIFTNPQLELGSVATQWEPRNDDYINFPMLVSNVDRTIADSYDTATGRTFRRWYTGVVLDGSLPWLFHVNNTGNKVVKVTLPTPAGTFRTGLVQKSDGTILSQNTGGTATYLPDNQVFDSGNLLYVSVGTADSGWGDSYNPSVAEIKAYFNGWRMNNGTVGTPYNGTGTKSWTPIVTPNANFVGKVSGSVVENPNTYKTLLMTTLLPPASITTEFATSSYSNIATLNAVTQPTGRSGAGEIAVQIFSFNLLEHEIRNHGVGVFGTATTTAERVAWLKAGNIPKFNFNWYGNGSGPNGNKATVSIWNGVAWSGAATNLTGSVAKVNINLTVTAGWIDTNGFVHLLAYADASNGTIASTINTDFIDLEAPLNLTTIPTTGYATVSYTPYKLDYVLAQGFEEPFVGDTGAIALQAGGNQLELMESVVVREKVTPVLFSNTNYLLNNTAYPVSYFKYVPDKVLAVYKNGIIDNRWIISFSSLYRNNVQVYINASDYDTTAEYTVTYQVLDKYLYTSNAINAVVQYKSNPKMVQDQLVQDMADMETQSAVNVRAIAELYKKVKALGG